MELEAAAGNPKSAAARTETPAPWLELLGAFAYAGEMGRGLPPGQVFRTCAMASDLASELGVSAKDRADVIHTALLAHAGCTAGGSQLAAYLASDELGAQKSLCLCDPDNMAEVLAWARRHVAPTASAPARIGRILHMMARGEAFMHELEKGIGEVGRRFAVRMGLGVEVGRGLSHICETWKGKGPHRLRGSAIPLASRIVQVAMVAEVLASDRGRDAAIIAVEKRSGNSLDPEVGRAFQACSKREGFWRNPQDEHPWEEVVDLCLEADPPEQEHPDLDEVLLVLADFADLKSPLRTGHSRRLAELCEALGPVLGMESGDVLQLRRAALIHDLGEVGVPSFVLDKSVRSPVEEEQYRLHPYFTEHIFRHAPSLAPAAALAAMHHERLDGTGFPKGLRGSQLPMAARILAVADAYLEAGEPEKALVSLRARAGKDMDAEVVAALEKKVRARPVAARPAAMPAGLTAREAEVLRLIATGHTNRDVAQALSVSHHTVRHHLESIYAKIGVSMRSGAVLFALENGFIPASRPD